MSTIFAHDFRAISSVGSEHLPYKQRVGGSTPSSPTKKRLSNGSLFCFYYYPIAELSGKFFG